MSEPITAHPNDLPGELAANTPAPPEPDKPTTHSSPDAMAGFVEALDLPDDIKAKLSPKPVEVQPADPEPVPPTAEVESVPPEPIQPEAIKDETDDDEDEIPEGKEVDWKRVADKRQKRINRLTRQKSEIETKLDAAFAQPQQPQIVQPESDPLTTAFSGAQPWMPDQETAKSYATASNEAAKSQSTIQWCNANSKGINIINDKGEPEFIEPERVAEWKSVAEQALAPALAEKTVLEREAKSAFKYQKQQFDAVAMRDFPELFNKTSQEYQFAQQVFATVPALRNTPRAMYDVGMYIKGLKTTYAESQTKNGNGKHKGDIDPRVFTTPRVPIAPQQPSPPSREKNVSSQQTINEAMSSHLKDPEGDGLVRMFAALEQSNRGTTTPRSRVAA